MRANRNNTLRSFNVYDRERATFVATKGYAIDPAILPEWARGLPFAITRGIGTSQCAGWTVTHLPTGASVGPHARTREAAANLCAIRLETKGPDATREALLRCFRQVDRDPSRYQGADFLLGNGATFVRECVERGGR